jgi:hypothetical protein
MSSVKTLGIESILDWFIHLNENARASFD